MIDERDKREQARERERAQLSKRDKREQARERERAQLSKRGEREQVKERSEREQVSRRDERERLRKQGASGRLLAFVLDRIDEADEGASVARVRALRERHPEWGAGQLIEHLIRRKCRQAAAVGAATAGSALVPGVGTLAALMLGTVMDVRATLNMQTELVLEIAEVYGRRLSVEEKRRVVLLVSGLTVGGGRLVSRGGAELSLQLTERYAQRWLTRLIPFAGVAASAGVNAISTYLVGRRADAYFRLGPQAVGNWMESLRALSGVDERKLVDWLGDRTWRSPHVERAQARLAVVTGVAMGAARSSGRGLAFHAERARRFLPGRRRQGPMDDQDGESTTLA